MRLIDADALKAKYEQMIPEIGDGYHKETLQDVLFELEYAPTISPDEVRGVGKWKLGYFGSISDATEKWYDKLLQGGFLYCSACKCRSNAKTNYCPNCGAKMEVTSDA